MSNDIEEGVFFYGLLGLLFVGLKLGGIINWSWWLVTSPLWGGLAVGVGMIGIIFTITGLKWLFGKLTK